MALDHYVPQFHLRCFYAPTMGEDVRLFASPMGRPFSAAPGMFAGFRRLI